MSQYIANVDIISQQDIQKELNVFLTECVTNYLGEHDTDMIDYVTALVYRKKSMKIIRDEMVDFIGDDQSTAFVQR